MPASTWQRGEVGLVKPRAELNDCHIRKHLYLTSVTTLMPRQTDQLLAQLLSFLVVVSRWLNVHQNNDNNDYDNNDRMVRRNSRCLHSPHCAANCLQHVRSSGQGATVFKSRATHLALITCNMSYATWFEGTAQLLGLTEFKLHLLLLYFIG